MVAGSFSIGHSSTSHLAWGSRATHIRDLRFGSVIDRVGFVVVRTGDRLSLFGDHPGILAAAAL